MPRRIQNTITIDAMELTKKVVEMLKGDTREAKNLSDTIAEPMGNNLAKRQGTRRTVVGGGTR